jgi:hypothetical protein
MKETIHALELIVLISYLSYAATFLGLSRRDVIRDELCLKLISDDFCVYRKTFSNLEKFGKSNLERSVSGMERAH